MDEQRRKEFFDRIHQLLGEYSEAFFVGVELPIENSEQTITLMSFDGGFNRAYGLMRRCELRMNHLANQSDFPPDELSEGRDDTP